jgi:hypothetical protein
MSDAIPYEHLTQSAMRLVVRWALERAIGGMPGQHHFFIAFRTRHPGVELPEALVRRYPDEMQVVLRQDYADLEVDEDAFSVRLSFDQVWERITVPLAAVTQFVDPSVEFGLRFDARMPESRPAESEAEVVSLEAFRNRQD